MSPDLYQLSHVKRSQFPAPQEVVLGGMVLPQNQVAVSERRQQPNISRHPLNPL
jgi:hypothetical protein